MNYSSFPGKQGVLFGSASIMPIKTLSHNIPYYVHGHLIGFISKASDNFVAWPLSARVLYTLAAVLSIIFFIAAFFELLHIFDCKLNNYKSDWD